MTGKIHEQVTDWLCEHGWFDGPDGDPRGALARQWVDVAERYGDESPAACGVLLVLVRDAWREQNVITSHDGVTWAVFVPDPDDVDKSVMVSEEDTEGFALAAALLAAPTKGDGR